MQINSKHSITALSLLLFSAGSGAELYPSGTYVSVGYNAYKYSTDAFKPYYKDNYTNDKDELLGGLYLDLSINAMDQYIVEGYADFATKFSASIDKWSFGGGYIPYNDGIVSTPLTCGALGYYGKVSNKDSKNKSEGGYYCKARASVLVADTWLADVSYQHEFLDQSKSIIRFDNSFGLGFGVIPILDRFNVLLGIEFSNRHSSEVGYRAGFKFAF